MIKIDDIREQLRKPSVKKDNKQSILLARKGLKITAEGSREWFFFQYLLAQFLLKRGKASDINTSIQQMENVRARITQKEQPRIWAETCLVLGSAFERQQTGDRTANFQRALEEFEQALRFFSKEAYPDLWATMKYHLGAVFALQEQGNSLENIENAINNYREALEVFTAKNSPENHSDILQAIKELEQERKAILGLNGKRTPVK